MARVREPLLQDLGLHPAVLGDEDIHAAGRRWRGRFSHGQPYVR
jgi:hypothetical protein